MEVNDGNTTLSETRCEFTPRMAIHHRSMQIPPWLSIDALNRLVNILDVQVIALSECVLGPGFELDLDGCDTPSFHYICQGYGRMYTANETPAEIGPQTLIIVPPLCSFRFKPTSRRTDTVLMLCGKFRSLCGNSIDLFDTLHIPIVEQFSKDDGMELKLQLALTELMSREVCSEVLASTAMKQVIVALIRRSVLSPRNWTRRFVALSLTEHESTTPRQNKERDDIR